MSLFKVQAVHDDFSTLNKLVYGFPKTGKSTFCAMMIDKEGRKPAFIATEDGHGALPGIFRLKVTSWDGFMRLIEEVKKVKDDIIKLHSSFVIDLVSDLDEMCSAYVCKQNNVKSLSDLEYGKGFNLHKTTFRAAINELFAILPITFITHSNEKEVMWNNEKIKIQSPSVSKQCLEFINGKVDLIMWIAPSNNKKEYPELVMRPSTTAIAGSRYPQLARNFTFKYDKLSETYQQLSDYFSGIAKEATESNPVAKEQ